jgi:hypothetical protein
MFVGWICLAQVRMGGSIRYTAAWISSWAARCGRPVWSVVQRNLTELLAQLNRLLSEADNPDA